MQNIISRCSLPVIRMEVTYRLNLTTIFLSYIPGKHYHNKNSITPYFRKVQFCYCSSNVTVVVLLLQQYCQCSTVTAVVLLLQQYCQCTTVTAVVLLLQQYCYCSSTVGVVLLLQQYCYCSSTVMLFAMQQLVLFYVSDDIKTYSSEMSGQI